jgi:hypothetical protein
MWFPYGERERFAIEIGSPDREHPTTGLREVDVYAAGRWLTCDDNTAHVGLFVGCAEGVISRLLTDPTFEDWSRPYPDLSIEDNYRRLLADAEAGSNEEYLRRRILHWGPLTDNISNCLFREGLTAYLAFSFWRPTHHDPSELGQVFIAELPERELLLILHRAAWDLAEGRRSRGAGGWPAR